MTSPWNLLGSPAGVPVLQLAADGQWETGASFLVDGDPAEVAMAADRLSRGAKFLAMELMWPGKVFVGTGWRAEHWVEATLAAKRLVSATPSTAEEALTALLGEKSSDEIESADLGAVNAWLSVGPELLWRHGDTVVVPALDGRPDLVVCTHPVAVEFGLKGTRPQWAAIVVSVSDGYAHRLDRGRLAAAMSVL